MSIVTILRQELAATENNSEYSLSPDAAVILMNDGSARLLDMGDRFYSLSPVAALMLCQALQHGFAAAAEHVATEYGIDLAKAEADLHGLLSTLEQRGILQRRGGERQSRLSPAAWLATWLLKVLLWLVPGQQVSAFVLLSGAKLSVWLFGWTRTVAAWRGQFQPRDGHRSGEETERIARAIDEAVCSAAAAHPLGVACKERALSCWALARRVGLPAILVIGVDLFPLAGHCWCEVGSCILSDHPENVRPYFPTLRYH